MMTSEPEKIIGVKYDADKPMYDLIPVVSLKEIVKVLTFGYKKYTRENWQHVDDAKQRYTSALMRHIEAWRDGEINDPETGIHHLGHAGCNVMFLLWFELTKNLNN